MHSASINSIFEKFWSVIQNPERLKKDETYIVPYLSLFGDKTKIICVIYPITFEEIHSIINIANTYNISIYTTIPDGLDPDNTGIILDMKEMKCHIEVDRKNLLATIESGVIFEQLQKVLVEHNCRIFMPATATTNSVLQTYLERDVLFCAGRYTNKQVAIVNAFLGDGRLYKSGSHALPNATVSHREDGGPNISKLLFQSKNSFGIPFCGIVNIYPYFESRKVIVKGFKTLENASKVSKQISNSEYTTECVVANSAKLNFSCAPVQSLEMSKIPDWTLIATIEGGSELVDYYEKETDKVVFENNGFSCSEDFTRTISNSVFQQPWYTCRSSFSFYTTYDRVLEFVTIIKKNIPANFLKDVQFAQFIIPIKRGTTVFIGYDILSDDISKNIELKNLLRLKILEQGGFFISPTGSFAQKVFEKTGNYYSLLKKLKKHVDKNNILNTGQVVQ